MRWTLPTGNEFVGNDTAKAQLAARIAGGSFPHAILIEGPQGSGKKTFARIVAAAAVCEQSDVPCGRCHACHKVFADTHPDVSFLGGSKEARSFHLDVVRSVRDQAYVLPNEAPRRVFVLCDVQAMTDQAQNALLKMLEEPPAHTVFILTCERRGQLLETVISRVFPVSLGGVSTEQAVEVLKTLLPEKDEDTLTQAASLWGGIIGQAYNGLQEGDVSRLLALLPPLVNGIVAPTELALLKATAPLEKNKEAVTPLLSGLQLAVRDALVLKSGVNTAQSATPDEAKTLSQALSQAQLLRLLSVIEDLQTARLYNMNHTLFLTTLCARLRQAVGR